MDTDSTGSGETVAKVYFYRKVGIFWYTFLQRCFFLFFVRFIGLGLILLHDFLWAVSQIKFVWLFDGFV